MLFLNDENVIPIRLGNLNYNLFTHLDKFSGMETFKLEVQCTVVGKVEINYFSILDFMPSGQTLEDIWRLQGQKCEKLYL